MFTFRIVLNRILHKSILLAPMESRRTRRPTFTAEERLERDRRRHAERRARERREQTQARRDVDRLRSSQARALETVEETAARRDVDRLQSSQARASETVEETAARRDVERLRSSQARAAETVEETTARTEVQRLRSSQARNRRRMAVTRAGETIIRDYSQNCADIHHRTWLRLEFFMNIPLLPLQGCASQAVVQFAPLLIIDVFLNQVTSVMLISLYFIHFMTVYIVIRPLIQSHL